MINETEFNKIISVIKSCKTYKQLLSATRWVMNISGKIPYLYMEKIIFTINTTEVK